MKKAITVLAAAIMAGCATQKQSINGLTPEQIAARYQKKLYIYDVVKADGGFWVYQYDNDRVASRYFTVSLPDSIQIGRTVTGIFPEKLKEQGKYYSNVRSGSFKIR